MSEEAVIEEDTTSGGSDVTTQEGAKTDTVGDGKKNTGPKDHLQYPLKRSGVEDTLLIRCVKYKPPKSGGSVFGKGRKQTTEDYTVAEGDFISGINGTQFNVGDNVPAGTWIKKDSEKKYSWNSKAYNSMAEGTDKRYNQHQKNYSGHTYNTDTQFYVELPIPKQISDGNAVDWGESSMNMFQMAGFGLASGALGDKGAREEAQAAIRTLQEGSPDQLEKLGFEGATEISNAMRAALGGMALNTLGGNITANQYMSRASGKILNSNSELLFNSVKLREFTFDFTFTPRSSKEGERAKQIIRRLKQHMSPKAGDEIGKGNEGLFINSPDLFLLRYLSAGEDHPFLNSFKPCALTALSVNYSAGGAYASYGTGGDSTPVHMGVKMTFKETNPIYFEDYNENVAGVGF